MTDDVSLVLLTRPLEIFCQRGQSRPYNPRSAHRQGALFLVLDSFNGSGSTMIVCEDLGRTYFGMELDPRYVDATIQRWEEHTGQTAVKLN